MTDSITHDLSQATAKDSPRKYELGNARFIRFYVVDSPFYVRVNDRNGPRLPIVAPFTMEATDVPYTSLFIDNDGTAGSGNAVVLYGDGRDCIRDFLGSAPAPVLVHEFSVGANNNTLDRVTGMINQMTFPLGAMGKNAAIGRFAFTQSLGANQVNFGKLLASNAAMYPIGRMLAGDLPWHDGVKIEEHVAAAFTSGTGRAFWGFGSQNGANNYGVGFESDQSGLWRAVIRSAADGSAGPWPTIYDQPLGLSTLTPRRLGVWVGDGFAAFLVDDVEVARTGPVVGMMDYDSGNNGYAPLFGIVTTGAASSAVFARFVDAAPARVWHVPARKG